MTKHCPLCQQVVPDPLPLPLRIRRLLADAKQPVPARELRSATRTTSAVMYQTLRRMTERGEVRKSTQAPVGTGYVLIAPDEEEFEVEATTPAETMRDLLEGLLVDLVTYVDAAQRVSHSGALQYLARLGVDDEETARGVIALALQSGRLQAEGQDLVAI